MKIINKIEVVLCAILFLSGIAIVMAQIYLGAISSFIGVLASVIGLAVLFAILYIVIDEYKNEE